MSGLHSERDYENKNALELAWVYDLRKDEWAKLTRMSQERDECERVVVFSFLLWTASGGGGGCCAVLVFFFFFFVFFSVDVFIIILMSYLHYFNQITKNIAPLLWGVKR